MMNKVNETPATSVDETPAPSVDETPDPLPPEVMASAEALLPQAEMPLHLRVLRAIVEGQTDQERFDRALVIAQEVYELETANIALEDYRSAS
jgi:hypothetical protein